jgi:hypothetical protein
MLPLRYVILRHSGIAEPHFDLMFETAPGSRLATWQSPNWPPGPGDVLTPLGPHRAAYLDYEGPVSGGRGAVARVAAGRCRIVESTAGGGIKVLLDDGRQLLLPSHKPT